MDVPGLVTRKFFVFWRVLPEEMNQKPLGTNVPRTVASSTSVGDKIFFFSPRCFSSAKRKNYKIKEIVEFYQTYRCNLWRHVWVFTLLFIFFSTIGGKINKNLAS